MATVDIHDPTVNNRAIPGEPIVFAILSAIACFLVVIRTYTRFWVKQFPGWDDYTIIPALVFALSWLGTQLTQTYAAGNGRHSWTFTPGQQAIEYRWNIASNDLGATSRFFARASICLFLLRVVQRTRYWRGYLYISMALNASVWIATVVIFSAACAAPSNKAHSASAWCMKTASEDTAAKVVLAFNALVDVMSALFPFLVLRGSQLNIRARTTVCFLVACCLLTAGCSIGRVIAIDYSSPDSNWDCVPLSYWSSAEQFGLVIVACLPATHQLFNHYRDYHTLSRIRESPNGTWVDLSVSQSGATGRQSHHTASPEKSRPLQAAVIKKTTGVNLEVHSRDGQRPDLSNDVQQEVDPEGAQSTL